MSTYMEQAHSQIEDLARDELLECRPRFLEWVSENTDQVAPTLVAAYCGAFIADPTGRRRDRQDRQAIAQGALSQLLYDYQQYRLDVADSSGELADIARALRACDVDSMREEV